MCSESAPALRAAPGKATIEGPRSRDAGRRPWLIDQRLGVGVLAFKIIVLIRVDRIKYRIDPE